MTDVVGTSRFFYQRQIALYLLPFAGRGVSPVAMGLGVSAVVDVPAVDQALVFAMSYDELAQCLGPQHGFFHHFWLLYTFSIVRESDDIGGYPF